MMTARQNAAKTYQLYITKTFNGSRELAFTGLVLDFERCIYLLWLI